MYLTFPGNESGNVNDDDSNNRCFSSFQLQKRERTCKAYVQVRETSRLSGRRIDSEIKIRSENEILSVSLLGRRSDS